MRRTMVLIAMIAIAALPQGPASAGDSLSVDDGDFFYDDPATPACVGVSDDPSTGEATRHWHVGIPFAPGAAEAISGFGCKGGPASWTVTVADGETGHLAGSIRYTWDRNVPGGGFNDVHLMITDADGLLVAHTALDSGPNPIVPMVDASRTNSFEYTLAPGTYTLTEDVFSGEHTAWLTKLEFSAFSCGLLPCTGA